MKGARGTMLCLYNRRTRRAEVQEAKLSAPVPPPAASVKDVRWLAREIGTRMACAAAVIEQETRYQRLLVDGRSIEVTPQGGLILTTAGKVQIRFAPERR